ncbi:hypothetical protein [Porphyromonas asaccharolytica]
MTTSKAVGETVKLRIEANGNVTIEGVKELPQLGKDKKKLYPYQPNDHLPWRCNKA